MKLKLLFYAPILAMTFISCKKDKNEPKSKTQLLTAHTWVYNEYFTNYNQANTILQYKKGKSNNMLNLNNDVLTFKADGTFSRIDYMGQPQSGTWQLLNNETQLSTIEGGVTHTSNIVLLNGNTFVWHDVPLGIYAEMIPK
jgi:hypothetical protein